MTLKSDHVVLSLGSTVRQHRLEIRRVGRRRAQGPQLLREPAFLPLDLQTGYREGLRCISRTSFALELCDSGSCACGFPALLPERKR